MTLQDWGALGELIGGFAIIISLIYVGLQIRQGTRASSAATAQAFSQQYADHMRTLIDAEFRNIFVRGLKGLDGLDEGELASFFAFLATVTRMWESFYYQKGSGALDGNTFDAWMHQLIDLHANKGVREFWAARKHHYTSEFVRYIGDTISASDPKPMYPSGDA